MKLRIRLMLENARGEPFMGIGLLQLLLMIEKERSLARAARALGLSYVKAFRIIQRLERNLRRPVLSRRRGGADRGGAQLTVFGRQVVDSFKRLYEEVEGSAATAFRRFSKELQGKRRKT